MRDFCPAASLTDPVDIQTIGRRTSRSSDQKAVVKGDTLTGGPQIVAADDSSPVAAGQPAHDPNVQPTMSVEEAGKVLGISRASAYEGVRAGEIPSIRIGRQTLVPTAAVRWMLGLDLETESKGT